MTPVETSATSLLISLVSLGINPRMLVVIIFNIYIQNGQLHRPLIKPALTQLTLALIAYRH